MLTNQLCLPDLWLVWTVSTVISLLLSMRVASEKCWVSDIAFVYCQLLKFYFLCIINNSMSWVAMFIDVVKAQYSIVSGIHWLLRHMIRDAWRSDTVMPFGLWHSPHECHGSWTSEQYLQYGLAPASCTKHYMSSYSSPLVTTLISNGIVVRRSWKLALEYHSSSNILQ